MIVKKLGMVSGGGFPGAGYNERKVTEGVARLMAMENVDAAMRHKVELLHEAGFGCAGEIEKYLKERSRTYGNTRTTRFQFHIAASVKGQVMSADELTNFARQLMAEAGYGRQPYFVYYHHDTDNNHVHILSTRIQPNGFPIPDHQDYARINAAANRILSPDINRDIQRMFSYVYLTEGQFANIIRSHGYKFERVEDRYVLFRGGVKTATISLSEIERHISQENDTRKERAKQLRAIIRKYKAEIVDGKVQNVENVKGHKGQKKKYVRRKVNPDIRKIKGSNGKILSQEVLWHLSELLDVLKSKFGIDIHFQKDRNGEIRGYGIVDHNRKLALDGNTVMKLSELIDFVQKQERKASPLDVYRSLFTAEIFTDGAKDHIRIHTKDGDTFEKTISANQSDWYRNTKPEDKEDVALMIASTAFTEEILMAYLSRQPTQNHLAIIQSVSAVMQRGGDFALRIVMNDGMSMMIPMDDQDEIRYRKLSPNDTLDFLNNLAVHYLTREDARSIIQRIRQNTQIQLGFGNRPLPHPQNFTPQIATAFSLNFASVLSCFKVDTERGENREREVGNRSRYDDLDTQQAGTHLSM